MLKSSVRVIIILAILALAGVRLAFVRKALSQAQSIDYSIKIAISAIVLTAVIYLIDLFSNKK